jgi:hypothetical protein
VIIMAAQLRGVVGRKEVVTLSNGRTIRRVVVFDGRDSWELAVMDGLMDQLVEGQTYDVMIRPRTIAGKLLLEVEAARPVTSGQKSQ